MRRRGATDSGQAPRWHSSVGRSGRTPRLFRGRNAKRTTPSPWSATYKDITLMAGENTLRKPNKPFYFNTSEHLLRIGRQKAITLSELDRKSTRLNSSHQ